MKKLLVPFLSLLAVVQAHAAPIRFDLADPKKVNHATFQLDAPLEAIAGTANGVSGEVSFDPAAPAGVRGKVVIQAASLQVPNPTMQEHLQGGMWLDVKKHAEITFETTGVTEVATRDNVTSAQLAGRLTLKGVTREIKTPVTLTYLKDKLRARGGMQDGDILVVRASFVIKRSEFGINAGKFEDKVADDIHIKLSLAGLAPR